MEENKFKIEIDGVVKEAELLKTVDVLDNKYAVYAVDKGDETSDIFASKIVKDNDGNETFADLETDDERKKLREIISAMFK